MPCDHLPRVQYFQPANILVTDFEEGDGEALILKDLSKDGEEESVFEIVSDDEELAAVAGVFENMLDDVTFV